VTRGSRWSRAPRVVLRSRGRTELQSRRSFFVGRQLLDRRCAIGRGRAAFMLRAMRRRGSGARTTARRHWSRTPRAAAPRTAIAPCPAEHADDPCETLSVSRLSCGDDGRSSRRRRSAALQRWRDRSRAARLREAARCYKRGRGTGRRLGHGAGAWRTVRRWLTAIEDGRLFRGIRLSPRGWPPRRRAERAAMTLLARSVLPETTSEEMRVFAGAAVVA
jgi:hypothetical protein